MKAPNPRVLLVDETSMFRTLARRRLEALGIACDEAGNYADAERFVKANEYAVVVTELHIPDRHPYHLVMELLRRPTRPLIVVATDIREPRMAQHLFDEGVDDVLFKPIDYALMAAKLKILAARWQKQWSPGHLTGHKTVPNESFREGQAIPLAELQTKLQHLTGMLPLSATAFDVFNATREDRFDAKQIEQAIAKEASLAVELLRLANSNAYNASAERITSLEQAVVRVGRRKIGELALAHTAKTALTQRVVPWLNVDLLWHRSVAASSAAELLEKQRAVSGTEGLVLPALMHSLGRVVLASLYPQTYEVLLERCEECRESLDHLEEQAFPLSLGGVMARVLELWGLPDAVWRPLADEDHVEMRLAKRLLQAAQSIGDLATANWQDFDRIQSPSVDEVITSEKVESVLAKLPLRQSPMVAGSNQSSTKQRPRMRYARVSADSFDLSALLLASFSEVEPVPIDDIEKPERVVIDCRDAAPYSLAPFVADRTFDPRRVIVANREDAGEFRRFGHVISFPTSYAAFRHACLGASKDGVVESRVLQPVPFQSPIENAFDTKL